MRSARREGEEKLRKNGESKAGKISTPFGRDTRARTSRQRSRIIVLYAVVATGISVAVLQDGASTRPLHLSLRYRDLDFSGRRVSIALSTLYTRSFSPDYNAPRLAGSLSNQPWKYISLSPAFLWPELTKDRAGQIPGLAFGPARSLFLTRLPDHPTDTAT